MDSRNREKYLIKITPHFKRYIQNVLFNIILFSVVKIYREEKFIFTCLILY